MTTEHAAKLVGMRKEEFAELSALRYCLLIVEGATWRYYLARFNYAFPECDRMAAKADARVSGKLGVRMFTDGELLTPPHLRTLREVMAGPENEDELIE